MHPLRILPVILESRSCNVDYHIVRQHQRPFIIADYAFYCIFQIIQHKVLAHGISAPARLAGEALGHQSVSVVAENIAVS